MQGAAGAAQPVLGFDPHINCSLLGPAPPRGAPTIPRQAMWAHWDAMLLHLLMTFEVCEVRAGPASTPRKSAGHAGQLAMPRQPQPQLPCWRS